MLSLGLRFESLPHAVSRAWATRGFSFLPGITRWGQGCSSKFTHVLLWFLHVYARTYICSCMFGMVSALVYMHSHMFMCIGMSLCVMSAP